MRYRWLPLFLYVSIVFFQNSTFARERADVSVYFGPRAYPDTTGVLFNFLRFIDSAEEYVYGSVHEMDLVIVAERLAHRAEKGISVELVLESDWLGVAKNSAAVDVLQQSQIQIYPDTKKSGLMHNKFFVVDGKRVWTGSTNLTETGFLYNYNNSVWLENTEIADNFLTEFNEQKAGRFGKSGSGAPNTPNPRVAIGSAIIETYFSPEDLPLKRIIDLTNQAKKSVDVLCFVFSSQEVSEALIKAINRGVEVRVLLDNSFASPASTESWRYVPFNEIQTAGGLCRYDREDAKVHHKVVIVDARSVVTGSLNLSNNGAKSNDENTLIIHDAAIAGKFLQEFNLIWDQSEPEKN